jgi:hypothetical protein
MKFETGMINLLDKTIWAIQNQLLILLLNSRNDYSNRNYKGAYINKRYDTYRELKKHIKEHLDICIETHVTVYHKRGEWGEWFEHWVLDDGKPVISNQGWN